MAQVPDVAASHEEQIDEALAILEKYDVRSAAAYIAAFQRATEENDRDGYDDLGKRVIQFAQRVQAQNEEPDTEDEDEDEEEPEPTPAPKRRTTTIISSTSKKATTKKANSSEKSTIGEVKRALGVIAWIFGLVLWVPGAHYQLDGWTMIVNAILGLVRSGVTIPLASGVWSLLLIPCGILYSIGERRYFPWRKAGQRWFFLGSGVVITWILVNGSDLLSAWIGINQPLQKDAWELTRTMAETPLMMVGWMIAVVYLGDLLFILGWKWMGLRLPRWLRWLSWLW